MLDSGSRCFVLSSRSIDPISSTEISPNRFEQARREFNATGTIVEPPVSRFREYIDVLFPLTCWQSFEIVPTAGWNAPMDKFRRAALARIEVDPARAAEWARYLAAQAKSDSAILAGGAVDDPRWIHTSGWDQAESIYLDVYQSVLGNDPRPGARLHDAVGPGSSGHRPLRTPQPVRVGVAASEHLCDRQEGCGAVEVHRDQLQDPRPTNEMILAALGKVGAGR